MSRKFVGSASAPTFCETLAAMGTADTPAEPMRGFTFPPVAMHIIFPNSTPAAVPNANATRPSKTMKSVSVLRKASALVVAPTDVPSMITTMYMSAFDAVSVSCLTTPDSRKRLPNISIPIRGAVVGRTIDTTIVMIIGKRIFSSFVTGLN